MYKENILSLKINKKLSPNFNSEVGVHQVDTLNPNLFKVYINYRYLPSIFKDGCGPVELNSCKLNCLLFADDVVLLSKTEQGMQTCLNRLQEYCKNWCLELNTEKTKIIIFNKSGKILKSNFFF